MYRLAHEIKIAGTPSVALTLSSLTFLSQPRHNPCVGSMQHLEVKKAETSDFGLATYAKCAFLTLVVEA